MRIWNAARLLLTIGITGCTSMAVITKPTTFTPVGGLPIQEEAYTLISARISVIGTCSLSSGTPFSQTKVLGSVAVRVEAERNTPVLLPLVPDLTTICTPANSFQVKQIIPYSPTDTRVSLVITSGFDRQLTNLSKAAAQVATALATGGAATTIKTMAELAATPGMSQLGNELGQSGGEPLHQFITIADPWTQLVIPAFVVEYDAFTPRKTAITSYNPDNKDKLFEIQIEKKPVFSRFWESYPIGNRPDRNAVINKFVQSVSSPNKTPQDGGSTTVPINLWGYTASRLGEKFSRSESCSAWQTIAEDFRFTPLDQVIFYRAMLDDGSATWRPEAQVLDNCKLPNPIEKKWRQIYHDDWATAPIEVPKNAISSEVWKREIAPLLDHASNALTAPNALQKKLKWQIYLSSLGAGKKSIEIQDQPAEEDVSDANREMILGALSSLTRDKPIAGCYMPLESNSAGEMYFIAGTASTPIPWTVEIKKNADGTTVTRIKRKSDGELSNFTSLGYEYDKNASCSRIRGLISKYLDNQWAPAATASAN